MLIGISGVAGAGKDAAADRLVAAHDFVKIAMADAIKRVCAELFEWSEDQLWGPRKNEGDPRYLWARSHSGNPIYLSPRHAMQQLGTEWGRACYENVWINIALRNAKLAMTGSQIRYDRLKGMVPDPEGEGAPYEGVVIPDIRFRNEIQAVQAQGGKVIRILRSHPVVGKTGNPQHRSETEQTLIDDSEFDAVIDNRPGLQTLSELGESVSEVLSHLSAPSPPGHDSDLVERAVRNAWPAKYGNKPRWHYVKQRFAVGRTRAKRLCNRYNFDPDEYV